VQASDVFRLGKSAAMLFLRDAPYPILASRLRYFEENMLAGPWDRWRVRTVVPLMIEHKVLRLVDKPLRLTRPRDV
jgi:hypothetical protein